MNQIGKLHEMIGTEDIIDFVPNQYLMAYSIGCIIVIYNLKSNRKTFINYHKHPIAAVKLINEGRVLITIDQSVECNSVVVLWDIASMKVIAQFVIDTDYKEPKPLFLFRIKRESYILLIGNLIHIISLENPNSITCDFYASISLNTSDNTNNNDTEYYDAKAFFNSNTIALITRNSLIYAKLESKEDSSTGLSILFRIQFPFTLMKNSLRMSSNVNWISFLNSKGICLLYDQNGNSRQSINPIEQDSFTCSEFYSDMILFGSSLGKIYAYSLYDLTPRFIIPPFILNYKEQCFINNRNTNTNTNSNALGVGPSIVAIYLTEGSDGVIIKSNDNSIVLSQLSQSIHSVQNKTNANEYHHILHLSFAHFDSINSIYWSHNTNNTQFYSCGKDQNLICYTSDNQDNFWRSSYFDIEKLFNSKQSNFSNKSTNKTVLNVIKLHPRYTNKLFAGDNKGCLYLFDTKEDLFQYNKEIVLNQSIESLTFSTEGDLVSIGFDNGMNIICDIESNCSMQLKLIEGFHSLSDIEFRRRNGHMLSLGYFYSVYDNDSDNDNILIYNKSKYELEMTSICQDNHRVVYSSIIKVIPFTSELLDFTIHSSRNYAIALIEAMQIVIVDLKEGGITAGIDLSNELSYAYSMTMDWSGLYLVVNCDFIEEDNRSMCMCNENRRDGIVMYEIGTGKVKGMMRNLFKVNSIAFSPNGEYLSIGGFNGCMSIWKLSNQIRDSIENVMIEMRRNKLFWYQYEIAYDIKPKYNSVRTNSNGNSNEHIRPNQNPFIDTNTNRNAVKGNQSNKDKGHSNVNVNANPKPMTNPNQHTPRGELLTIGNIFEANTKRDKDTRTKEDKDIIINDSLPPSSSGRLKEVNFNNNHTNSNKINHLSSINNRSIHSYSNMERTNNELKEVNENNRINELKEQLINKLEEEGDDDKNNSQFPNRAFKSNPNHLQIQTNNQMSLEGNKANYIPMKLLLQDPSNMALTKERFQSKDSGIGTGVLNTNPNQDEERKEAKATSAQRKTKPIMLNIEKPIKPLLPFISFTNPNDNEDNKPNLMQQIPNNQDRVNDINQAINQIVSNNKPKHKDEYDLKCSQLTFGESTNNLNARNSHRNIYPEPEDIDDDFSREDNNNTKTQSPQLLHDDKDQDQAKEKTYGNPNKNTEIIRQIPIRGNDENQQPQQLNSSMLTHSKQSIADDIDFLSENIEHFESIYKLK